MAPRVKCWITLSLFLLSRWLLEGARKKKASRARMEFHYNVTTAIKSSFFPPLYRSLCTSCYSYFKTGPRQALSPSCPAELQHHFPSIYRFSADTRSLFAFNIKVYIRTKKNETLEKCTLSTNAVNKTKKSFEIKSNSIANVIKLA